MRRDLERRLEALEESDGPIIDNLADMVRWCARGCPDGWRWDPHFRAQMEELAKEAETNS